MIKQDIKIGLNRLLRFKAYSLINISGLAIAIASSLVIFSYVYHHFTFDKYISDVENSYRIISRIGDGTYNTNTFASFENYLSDCKEVKSYTRNFIHYRLEDVFIEDRKIEANSAIFANESFLDYFSVNIVEGERKSINLPNTMMLTPDMAKKIFPNKSAIGQIVSLRSFTRNQDSLITYTVSGIIEPLPKTSHLKYEILLSQKGHFEPNIKRLDSRKVYGALTYVKLFPSVDVKEFEKKLTLLPEAKLANTPGPPLSAYNHKLQNVNDIHFTQGLMNEPKTTVSRSFLNTLIMVGVLILVLATINFVIISIARQSFHQKNTFIFRFFGGSKISLINQVIIEIVTSISISFITAFALLSILENNFAKSFFFDNSISLQNPTLWNISIILFLLVNFIVLIFTSIDLLKRNYTLQQTNQVKNIKSAIMLVVFQFAIVIVLIGFATSINLQMGYINNKELGYSNHNVLVIKVPQSNQKVNLLKQELALIPGISNTGTAHHYPGYHLQDMNPIIGGHDFQFKFGYIDYQAIKTLDIKPLKYFTENKENATDVWMINETFYNNLKMYFSDEQIASGNFSEGESQNSEASANKFIVNGVMKDFHYASLHSKVENFAFYIPKPEARNNRFVLARLDNTKINLLISKVEDKLNEIYPGQPVNYSFLDEQLSKEYISEQTLLKLINIFSILSIIIACFGLIGLVIFITERRTKEIGLRKVNGASDFEIIKLLNLNFIKWISIAFLIATPISYYVLITWLQNFAYKITLSWWIFVLAGMITLVIAILTVSWQTFKAARKNPVDVLRYE